MALKCPVPPKESVIVQSAPPKRDLAADGQSGITFGSTFDIVDFCRKMTNLNDSHNTSVELLINSLPPDTIKDYLKLYCLDFVFERGILQNIDYFNKYGSGRETNIMIYVRSVSDEDFAVIFGVLQACYRAEPDSISRTFIGIFEAIIMKNYAYAVRIIVEDKCEFRKFCHVVGIIPIR